jgi:non-specific serine/threonine protein kinase
MDDATAGALLDLAEDAAPRLTGPDAKSTLDALEVRHDDLTSAIAWFIDEGRHDEALRLANALYRFWITTRRFEDGARAFDLVLGSGDGDERLRGGALLNAGFMPFWLGDDGRAADRFALALDVGRHLDDAPLVSGALGGLARVALRTEVADGRRLAAEALEVSEAAGDDAGISNALHLLGVGAQIAGDLPEAREWMTRRLAMARAEGNEFLIASEASNLSMVERQLGDLDTAEALAREVLESGRRTGERFTVPFALSGLAAIAVERGQHERAAILIGAAEAEMEASDMAWPPDERPHYERTLAALAKALPPPAFERARAEGHAMSADEAVDVALRGDAGAMGATPTGR